jgi:sensor histidine kinase YesM
MALSWYLSALPLTTLAYFGILGVGAAITFLGEARRRERDAARLAAQLAEARLGALQMQLHPHFLFNTLNAINVLARDGDTVGVSRMLTLLSELLRDVLRTDVTHEVPFSEELAFARRYLAIELVRFEDRLRVIEDIDDDTLELAVPCFVLQPLIENALRHGLAPRAAGGTIEIVARVSNGVLELRVQDDGAGLPRHWSEDGYGIGLSNTVARVRELYGPDGTVSVSQISGGSTCAMVRIPAHVSNTRQAATPERELASAF